MKETILQLVQGQEYNTKVYHNCTICPDDKERKILKTYRTGSFVEAHCYSTKCPAHGPHRFYLDAVNPEAVKRALLKKEKQDKDRIYKLPSTLSSKIPQKFVDYLAGYGVGIETIFNQNMGYVSYEYYDNVVLKDRLIIPIQDGFAARSLTDTNRKWINKGRMLISKLRHQTDDSVVLVEDPISTLRVGQIMPCVCLFGTSLKENQFNILVMKYKEALIWLDNDSAGIRGRTKIKAQLSPYIKTRIIVANKDPKEFSKEEIQHLLGV